MSAEWPEKAPKDIDDLAERLNVIRQRSRYFHEKYRAATESGGVRE